MNRPSHAGLRRFPALLLALVALPAAAAEPVDETPWTPSAEFGLVHASGNSETASVNGRFGLVRESARWSHDYSLSGLRAEADGELSANRFQLAGKSAWRISDRSSLGGAARHEHDDFGSYAYQSTLALTYGYQALREDDVQLRFEAGPGLRRAELASTGEHEESGLLRGFADYRHQLTDSTRLFNTLLVEATDDNTFVQNEIGIAVSINRSLALKAALQARHNSTAPAGTEPTDTLTSVNIVWSPKRK
ncbi:DUF481 domain-containing protein [Arenimonas composti]|uniref:Salt-induced outer membrane protein n=1 Tax=Arenimonas composti TR7-09 = DSM 18010 TaxID=1121013 RepID=A0A091C1H6_9GAMM|nr:DUF481 domain-containing protein [Arenimonas composti]KFN50455.1 hypothetical protein P873_07265 [Arenimonas composti TR7-09 = DSM 18010]